MCLKVVLLVTILCGTIRPLVGQGKGKIVGRIHGGSYAVGLDVPWLVSIGRNGYHWCGGAILNARAVLTAAHCFYETDTTQLTVRAGSKFKSSGGQLIPINEAVYHVDYDKTSLDYDIGVVRLSWDIFFSNNVQAVAIPMQGAYLYEGTEAILSGWGETERGDTEYLRYVVLNILGEDTCRTIYTGYKFTDRMLCAGVLNAEIGQCGGDSGSPLVVDRTVVGIASFIKNKCGLVNEAGVFTRVPALVHWIMDYLAEYDEELQ